MMFLNLQAEFSLEQVQLTPSSNAQGWLWFRAQPMRNDVTMQRRLSAAEAIMIFSQPLATIYHCSWCEWSYTLYEVYHYIDFW